MLLLIWYEHQDVTEIDTFISISMRVGRDTAFFVGKSKGKELEITELRKKLKKNCVSVYYYD